MKKKLSLMLLLLIAATTFAKNPKYVFYFIGDGMGPSHVLGTELYIGEINGVIGRPQPLRFTQFPHTAFVTTFSASNGVTDSAASGTALATGNKTNNGYLGTTPDGTPVYSIAHAAQEAGYAVGISTTVPINHATPGAFYAHQKSRNNYPQIAQEMLTAGYCFYAGGDPICNNEERSELYTKAQEQGYTIVRGYNEYKTLKKTADKMMLYQKEVATELPYSIDRESDDLTLAQITEAGIDFLSQKSKKGFFFMIEGGKIDYASHSDDAATMMHEVKDFNAAIEVAYEFYKKHKDETLIIVTADHETGGIVLGYSGAYALNLKALSGQKVSADKMATMLKSASHSKELSWEDVKTMLQENFGLWKECPVSKEETHRLRALYEQAYSTTDKSRRDSKLSSIADAAKQIVSHNALISWASGNHSGSYVPLFAIGAGAKEFHGVIDNTDVPKIIKKAAKY
ncbi:MAG: alkaline phosphatase [Bacteroidaceae bacterium]|nr:alkaline phosphatase [Bacteroidaceae bacterium]